MLNVTNLQFAYPNAKPIIFPDFKCGEGEKALILGQSGCGKTTLLHLLAGLLHPKQGSIQIGSQKIEALSGRQLDQFRGQHIGVVFQKPHFIKSLKAQKNIAIAQYLANKKPNLKRIQDLMEQLGIGHKTNANVQALSQGEQQRLAIARALINKPQLILADEPTSALDDKNCAEVIDLLEKQARENGATLLVVTHDQRLKDRFQNQIHLEALTTH